MLRFYSIIVFALAAVAASAQPANDDCATATELPDVLRYCSGPGAFTTAGATTSLEQRDYAICIDERTEIKDVWFTFRATRNSVSISVAGDVPGNSKGSLQQPQFSLMGGSCGDFETLACRSPFVAGGNIQNSGSVIFNELQRGEIYYIMVGARNGNEGTFELCVDQFDAVPEPSGDCGDGGGVILCDKSPFAVQALSGRGNRADDLLTSPGICGGSDPDEFNSSWYKWTTDQPGTLSFTITPLGAAPNEDIDFVVYEFPSGLDNCGDRVAIREMFSGETSGGGADNNRCLKETGLQAGSGDTRESCGCQSGDNNFLEPIDMEVGKSYGIVIMNFTGSGEGFEIEFGGTGTFLGPEPNLLFSTTEACVGSPVTFEDRSTSVDGIASWEWGLRAQRHAPQRHRCRTPRRDLRRGR